MRHNTGRSMVAQPGRSSLFLTAGASVCALVLVVVWSIFGTKATTPAPSAVAAAVPSTVNTGAEPDISDIAANTEMTAADIGLIGPAVANQLIAQYQTLKENGVYTPEVAGTVAREFGENIHASVPYTYYAAEDLSVGTDRSYEGMLAYRAHIKAALDPIASLEKLEISIFAQYVETSDPAYLEELRAVVADYGIAREAVAAVTVPPDAVARHVDILNAMGQFGAALEALADNADDPITSTVLLRSYNDAENNMISSFNNLAKYFVHHPQS